MTWQCKKRKKKPSNSRVAFKYWIIMFVVSDLHTHLCHSEPLRMKKKSVPMSELSEEAQRLKRAAWRAASRRYYARKIARQQANSARLGTFSQVRDFRSSQGERRTLMQELPNDRHMLQRAAPATYCTSNITHHQTEPTQAGHLPQDAEWLEGPLETNGRGSHDISGGIMCSWVQCSGWSWIISQFIISLGDDMKHGQNECVLYVSRSSDVFLDSFMSMFKMSIVFIFVKCNVGLYQFD